MSVIDVPSGSSAPCILRNYEFSVFTLNFLFFYFLLVTECWGSEATATVCGKVLSNCLFENITQPSHRSLSLTMLFWIRNTPKRLTCYRLHTRAAVFKCKALEASMDHSSMKSWLRGIVRSQGNLRIEATDYWGHEHRLKGIFCSLHLPLLFPTVLTPFLPSSFCPSTPPPIPCFPPFLLSSSTSPSPAAAIWTALAYCSASPKTRKHSWAVILYNEQLI